MGWGNCGTDSEGRPIGYIFEATCDHPTCNVKIDRGLSYVCGDMHGEDEVSCEKYFCEKHRSNYLPLNHKNGVMVCDTCYIAAIESDFYYFDEDDELIYKEW